MFLNQILIEIDSLDSEERLYVYENLQDILTENEELLFQGAANGKLKIHKNKGEIFVHGDIKCRLIMNCSRCLEEFTYKVEESFMYLLKPLSNNLYKGESSIKNNEMDVTWYDGETIDAGELFLGQIILNLPLQGLCSKKCRGLCSTCGINLNQYKCECVQESTAKPFASLKDILKSSP